MPEWWSIGHQTLLQVHIRSFSTSDFVEAWHIMQVLQNCGIRPIVTKHEVQNGTELHATTVASCTEDNGKRVLAPFQHVDVGCRRRTEDVRHMLWSRERTEVEQMCLTNR